VSIILSLAFAVAAHAEVDTDALPKVEDDL
jgi:hypothetical protein